MNDQLANSELGKVIQEMLSLLQKEMNLADSFINDAEKIGDKVDEAFYEGRFKGLNISYCNLYNKFYCNGSGLFGDFGS